jgi:hypothetical protein
MTQANNQSHLQGLSLSKRMLIGGVIGLFVASFFLVTLRSDHPDWGRFWMIQPLVVLPFAGAMGGLCNYYILLYRGLVGINKTVAIIGSIIVSVIGLWMGVVLGFHGTMWN